MVTRKSDRWQELYLGRRDMLVHPIGDAGEHIQPRLVFPGSFNPLHDGHHRMAEIACRIEGAPVFWEISVQNVEKPPLDQAEVNTRLRQFQKGSTVLITRAATFVQKALLFPGATFIVGADTLSRIVSAEYYDDRPNGVKAAVASIRSQGCRFIVFGRIDQDARFQSLRSLSLPDDLRAMCQAISEADFRIDASSSAIRSIAKQS